MPTAKPDRLAATAIDDLPALYEGRSGAREGGGGNVPHRPRAARRRTLTVTIAVNVRRAPRFARRRTLPSPPRQSVLAVDAGVDVRRSPAG
jgi:hypothetical protein